MMLPRRRRGAGGEHSPGTRHIQEAPDVGPGRPGRHCTARWFSVERPPPVALRVVEEPRPWSAVLSPACSFLWCPVPPCRLSRRARRPPATLHVRLPLEGASLIIEGAPIKQGGMTRLFVSPLDPALNYTYTVVARWNDYSTITRTRMVAVKAGATVGRRPAQADEHQPGRNLHPLSADTAARGRGHAEACRSDGTRTWFTTWAVATAASWSAP